MSQDLTVQEQRAYVESRWFEAEMWGFAGNCWEVLLGGETRGNSSSTEDEAWSAAYAFTVAREREIAELGAGIDLVKAEAEQFEGTQTGLEWETVLARLQRDHESLKRDTKA